MPIRRSIPPAESTEYQAEPRLYYADAMFHQPADQQRRRNLFTTAQTRCSMRPTVQRSPQHPVHVAQRAQGVTALTWFSPPVEAVAPGVAAEQSPATWSHM
nr:unnamed protein product [Spirometra erinaceieuropaei]